MDNRRRQILADMGIDSWQLRSASAGLPPVAESDPAVAADADIAEPLDGHAAAVARVRRLAEELAGPGERETARPPTVPPPGPAAPVADAAVRGGTALAFQIWRLGDAALLLMPADDRQLRRLALDLLAAASGLYGQRPAEAAFDGRALADGAANLDAERVLQAFLARRLGGADTRILLVDAALAEPLAKPLAEDFQRQVMVLPELADLAWSPDAKRNLWQQLNAARL